MNEIIFWVEDSPEDGYEARALNASIYTEADTVDELRFMIKDTIECHFEEGECPQIIRLNFVHKKFLSP